MMVVQLSMSKSVFILVTLYYSDKPLKCIDGSVSDLFIRTNSLLYDISNVDSTVHFIYIT